MLWNKIKLNLKTQLEDQVFCVVYRASKLLKQIPEHRHSWNLLLALILKGQGVNIVKIIEIGKLKFLHNKWRERVLIISAMIFKLQFKTVIENHSSYFVKFLIFVCLWTNHFVTTSIFIFLIGVHSNQGRTSTTR